MPLGRRSICAGIAPTSAPQPRSRSRDPPPPTFTRPGASGEGASPATHRATAKGKSSRRSRCGAAAPPSFFTAAHTTASPSTARTRHTRGAPPAHCKCRCSNTAPGVHASIGAGRTAPRRAAPHDRPGRNARPAPLWLKARVRSLRKSGLTEGGSHMAPRPDAATPAAQLWPPARVPPPMPASKACRLSASAASRSQPCKTSAFRSPAIRSRTAPVTSRWRH